MSPQHKQGQYSLMVEAHFQKHKRALLSPAAASASASEAAGASVASAVDKHKPLNKLKGMELITLGFIIRQVM